MYLGIDLGTSEVKALVIDENHEVIASHSAPLSIQRPHPHWSEQAPELWWEATECLMSTLRENARSTGRPSRRLASPDRCTARCCWMKRGSDPSGHSVERHRCAAECAELEAMAPELHQVAGNLAMPGFTAPKLLWVRRHEPQHFQRTATVLLPKDYLRYRMTGKKSPTCRTPPGRCGWTWRSATGPTLCWTSAACRAAKCRRWSKAARFPPPLIRRWRRAGG